MTDAKHEAPAEGAGEAAIAKLFDAVEMADDYNRLSDRTKRLAKDFLLDSELRDAVAYLRARSSAPEGGAVDDGAFKIATDLHAAYEQLIYGLPKYLDAENLTDEENMIREAWVTLDVTAHRLAALATREAPAEAGEDAIKAACVAWHQAKGENPFNVLYHGAWCGSFPHQTGPERWTFTVPAMQKAIAAYLRAQPQARSGEGQ